MAIDWDTIDTLMGHGGTLYHVSWYRPGDEDIARINMQYLIPATQDYTLSELYLIPSGLSSSDYFGSGVVGQVNRDVIRTMTADLPHVIEVYGGHNYADLAFDVRFFDSEYSEAHRDVIDSLVSLCEYPVLCEDSLYALESDLEREAWIDWAESEFLHALEMRYGDLDIPSRDLEKIFSDAQCMAQEYWVHESSGPYVDVQSIADSATVPDEYIRSLAKDHGQTVARAYLSGAPFERWIYTIEDVDQYNTPANGVMVTFDDGSYLEIPQSVYGD
jgi:hypothetical protein